MGQIFFRDSNTFIALFGLTPPTSPHSDICNIYHKVQIRVLEKNCECGGTFEPLGNWKWVNDGKQLLTFRWNRRENALRVLRVSAWSLEEIEKEKYMLHIVSGIIGFILRFRAIYLNRPKARSYWCLTSNAIYRAATTI